MTTRTAARRREQARAEHLRRMAVCPTLQLLDRMSGKWASLILKELAPGPMRSGELSRALAGASQKMLTQTLRSLERDGLVSRSITASVPVRVDYRLTPLGRSLLPVIATVTDWAERHLTELDLARKRYDRRIEGHDAGE